MQNYFHGTMHISPECSGRKVPRKEVRTDIFSLHDIFLWSERPFGDNRPERVVALRKRAGMSAAVLQARCFISEIF